MKSTVFSLLAVSLLFLFATPKVHGQDVPQTGYQAEFLFNVGDMAKKFTSLAEAIPEDKYSWRPGEGVRSIGEALTHAAGANYMIGRMVGADVPEGFPKEDSALKSKQEIIDYLKSSFDYLNTAVSSLSEADAGKEVTIFGDFKRSQSGALWLMSVHMGQHLGQLIAYARTNSVAPPWSE